MLETKRSYASPSLVRHGVVAELTETVLWKCTPGTDDLLGATAPGADDPLYNEPQPGRVCIDP